MGRVAEQAEQAKQGDSDDNMQKSDDCLGEFDGFDVWDVDAYLVACRDMC